MDISSPSGVDNASSNVSRKDSLAEYEDSQSQNERNIDWVALSAMTIPTPMDGVVFEDKPVIDNVIAGTTFRPPVSSFLPATEALSLFTSVNGGKSDDVEMSDTSSPRMLTFLNPLDSSALPIDISSASNMEHIDIRISAAKALTETTQDNERGINRDNDEDLDMLSSGFADAFIVEDKLIVDDRTCIPFLSSSTLTSQPLDLSAVSNTDQPSLKMNLEEKGLAVDKVEAEKDLNSEEVLEEDLNSLVTSLADALIQEDKPSIDDRVTPALGSTLTVLPSNDTSTVLDVDQIPISINLKQESPSSSEVQSENKDIEEDADKDLGSLISALAAAFIEEDRLAIEDRPAVSPWSSTSTVVLSNDIPAFLNTDQAVIHTNSKRQRPTVDKFEPKNKEDPEGPLNPLTSALADLSMYDVNLPKGSPLPLSVNSSITPLDTSASDFVNVASMKGKGESASIIEVGPENKENYEPDSDFKLVVSNLDDISIVQDKLMTDDSAKTVLFSGMTDSLDLSADIVASGQYPNLNSDAKALSKSIEVDPENK
ncbi:hypothetical protein HDU67_003052, partial [Dinochytrium kinnereticum]